MSVSATVTVSVAAWPVWNVNEVLDPSNIFWPLNITCPTLRFSSSLSWTISLLRVLLSAALYVSLAACTDKTRIRCSKLECPSRALSAVWANDIPSFAFRTAWFKPSIWDVIRFPIAKPAASSIDELMRLPEDMRSIDCSISLRELDRCLCVESDAMLVLMTLAMISTPFLSFTHRCGCFSA